LRASNADICCSSFLTFSFRKLCGLLGVGGAQPSPTRPASLSHHDPVLKQRHLLSSMPTYSPLSGLELPPMKLVMNIAEPCCILIHHRPPPMVQPRHHPIPPNALEFATAYLSCLAFIALSRASIFPHRYLPSSSHSGSTSLFYLCYELVRGCQEPLLAMLFHRSFLTLLSIPNMTLRPRRF
jgi:hypothetical protein